MLWLRTLVAASVFLSADEPPEIPLVGRPADLPFSDASAGFHPVPGTSDRISPFSVTATADPTRMERLGPIRFQVTVRASGKVLRPPKRIDLALVPTFNQRFYITELADGTEEKPAANQWNWAWRLRPRSTAVREIPGLPFIYYNPDLRPVEKGFQTIYSDPIELTVQPAEVITRPVEVDPAVLRFRSLDNLHATKPTRTVPSAVQILLGFLLPALVVAVGVWVLHRLHPDALRQARRHRGRATSRALRLLASARRLTGRKQAEEVSRALCGWLRERLGWPAVEPTPLELTAALRERRCPEPGIAPIVAALEATTAARFGPEGFEEGLIDRVKTAIEQLEEVWPPST